MNVQMSTRHASLEDLSDLLFRQQGRKVDVVAPASKISAENGVLVIEGADAVLTEDGVTTADGRYVPTNTADEGVGTRLNIPIAYLRRMRETRPDLYDANVNGWLHGGDGFDPDVRKFMVRAFRGDDGESGIARAFLSDSYLTIDHLDVLSAVLDGVRQAGVQIEVRGADLTERRMYVRIVAPQVEAYARELVKDYRSPFTGQTGAENPVVFAGLHFSNSEVGVGAFSVVPRMELQVCKNGLTMTTDAVRAIHLGSKMDEGVIRYSEDTQQKNLALVTAKTRDAVATFLDEDYMKAAIRRLEQTAGKPLADPAEDVKVVAKKMLYSEDQTRGILDFFIRGGQVTAGGVMQAVTAYAQTVEDADVAAELEGSAVRALATAAAL